MKHLLRDVDKYHYSFRRRPNDADGERGEKVDCDSCGYPAPLTDYQNPNYGHDPGKKYYFCAICYNSRASRVKIYFNQYRNFATSTEVTMFAANAVLDEMGAFDRYPTTILPFEKEEA